MLVATWNVHRGRGTLGPFRPGRAVAVLAEIGADLVALQEAQHHLRRGTPMFDEVALLRDAGLRPLPVAERPDQQGWRANLLLARPGVRVLRGPVALRLGGWEPRGGILAEVDAGHGLIRVACAHLSLGAATRARQAAALLRALHDGPAMPLLLMGDLNEWRPGASALGVLEASLGASEAVPGFPAFRPRLALDRIMGAPRGLVTEVRAHDTPAARRASDHLPLLARLDPAAMRVETGPGMA